MICDLAVTECNAEDRLNKPESDRCSEKYLGILSRLNQVFVKWLLKKNVTVLCGYLAKLISKITLTIIQLADRTRTEVDLLRLGVTNEQLTDLLAWISRLAEEEEKEILTLYTVLLQNLSETAASILLRLPPSAGVPAHVKATVDLMKMIHGI